MITVGGVLAIAFVLFEWKLAAVPIMPRMNHQLFSNSWSPLFFLSSSRHAPSDRLLVRLFQAPHCSWMYAQSFFSGACFYGNFFYSKPPSLYLPPSSYIHLPY